MNNYTSQHSPGANCATDDCEPFIRSVERLLSKGHGVEVFGAEADEELVITPTRPNYWAARQHGYIAGYMARTLLKSLRCQTCKADLLSDVVIDEHELIEARAYTHNSLLRPNSQFIKLFGTCIGIAHNVLPRISNHPGIKKTLMRHLT